MGVSRGRITQKQLCCVLCCVKWVEMWRWWRISYLGKVYFFSYPAGCWNSLVHVNKHVWCDPWHVNYFIHGLKGPNDFTWSLNKDKILELTEKYKKHVGTSKRPREWNKTNYLCCFNGCDVLWFYFKQKCIYLCPEIDFKQEPVTVHLLIMAKSTRTMVSRRLEGLIKSSCLPSADPSNSSETTAKKNRYSVRIYSQY